MKKIILGIILATSLFGTAVIAAPSIFRSTVINWKDVPEVNVSNTTKIYYANGAYVTRFFDGKATCYIYSTPSVTSLSCIK